MDSPGRQARAGYRLDVTTGDFLWRGVRSLWILGEKNVNQW